MTAPPTRTWSSRPAVPGQRSERCAGRRRRTGAPARSDGHPRAPAGRAGASDHPQGRRPAPVHEVRASTRGRHRRLRARPGRAVRRPVQGVAARPQGGLADRGGLPAPRPHGHRRLQAARPPAGGSAGGRVRGQQRAGPRLPGRHAQHSRRQDRRGLVVGWPAAGPGAERPSWRRAGSRRDAAVRQRRPPHPAERESTC